MDAPSIRIVAVALVTTVACIAGACSPTLRELTVRVPYTEAGYKPPMGNDRAPALAELRTRIEGWGVEITYEDGEKRFGGTNLVTREIVLQEGLSPNAEFEVLAHEGAHLFQPVTVELRSHGEAFAEAVAVGVTAFYGHRDYQASAARYLAGWKVGLSAIDDLKVDIDFAVKALTGQAQFEGWWK